MSQTLSYKNARDLLTGMSYKRGNTGVASRTYTYDAAGRPITRNTARNGTTVNDSFGYNTRSELTAATVNNGTYSYNYDNIGNRNTAQEITEEITNYTTNNLNQYTAIGDFAPIYDAAGNQTLVKTTTGIWTVAYDAENRPVSFTNEETNTVMECSYDYMGRRATKKVTVDEEVTLHHRYLYRGFLQIACCDLTRSNHPALWLITWDPTQPIATRPLAIQKDATWYTYGWDLTKNICEVYGINGYIRTTYAYTPYGAVTISGDVTQPIQWSSEFHDDELALVYYNYRHYNPTDGRWLSRDSEQIDSNPYLFVANRFYKFDILGQFWQQNQPIIPFEDLSTIIQSMDFSDLPWLEKAIKEIGVSETNRTKMDEYVGCLPSKDANIIKGKMDTDKGPWCACFIYFCTGGFVGWPTKPCDTVRAREYCNVWSAQQTPVLGAIAVLKFKSGNCHVAFVIGEDLNSIYVLGENQDNAVQLSKYAKNLVIAYRYPQGKRKRRPISIIPGSGSDKEDSTR